MSISSDLIPRQAHHALARISQAFPVLALNGPRQSGETTLSSSSFPEKPYPTLEDPETAAGENARTVFFGYRPAVLAAAPREPDGSGNARHARADF